MVSRRKSIQKTVANAHTLKKKLIHIYGNGSYFESKSGKQKKNRTWLYKLVS